MSDFEIINCHVHAFTARHAPRYFPVRAVVIFRYLPFLLQFLRWASRAWPNLHGKLVRLEAFHRTGLNPSQRAVVRELLHFYPSTSRHVILPMDMGLIGHGPVDADIHEQHDELAELARDPIYGPRIIPFATVYPDRPDAGEEFRERIERDHFRGLKLYPKLGFAPDHPVLMEKVYPLCVKYSLPVVSHCSRGGVYHKGWTQDQCDAVTEPDAFYPVLRAFPDLRVCLAHFGGEADWDQYLRLGFDPESRFEKRNNWVARIDEMIEKDGHDNLWTDISYTIFKFADHNPLLRLFLQRPRLRRRILFGSDFYMTRQEELSEKAISIRLRDALGEQDFRQIACTNPRVWLGFDGETAMPPPSR